MLFLAVIIAALAVMVSVASSLAGAGPAVPDRPPKSRLPVSVFCPVTGDLAFAELGFDWGTSELAVASCERFSTGVLECDCECFRTQVLPATAASFRSIDAASRTACLC